VPKEGKAIKREWCRLVTTWGPLGCHSEDGTKLGWVAAAIGENKMITSDTTILKKGKQLHVLECFAPVSIIPIASVKVARPAREYSADLLSYEKAVFGRRCCKDFKCEPPPEMIEPMVSLPQRGQTGQLGPPQSAKIRGRTCICPRKTQASYLLTNSWLFRPPSMRTGR